MQHIPNTRPVPTFPEEVPAQGRPTAVIYCEANFAKIDGKTANGLVRHSERYEILSVIDSTLAGQDSGVALGEAANGIPILADLASAVKRQEIRPDYLIFGMAPASGMLTPGERTMLLDAMRQGFHLVNGLHEFLNDDPEFAAAGAAYGVRLLDVRRPRDKKDLRMFSGRIDEVTCPVIAILGTDGAVGKRTTATILTKALNDSGIKAVLVSTGQTGLIQGTKYGLAVDAIPCQFASGEIEAAVLEAFETEHPDVIIVEGQGALSHPAYISSAYILRGARPNGVILQHAPARRMLSDFPAIATPAPAAEINLIETFADTRVIGLSINHENMTDAEITAAITMYELELGIPSTDAVARPTDQLVSMVVRAFPQLREEPVVLAT